MQMRIDFGEGQYAAAPLGEYGRQSRVADPNRAPPEAATISSMAELYRGYGLSAQQAVRPVEREAIVARSGSGRRKAERLYTVAYTLFGVMFVLLAADWVFTVPALFIVGGALGSAGCFVAAEAKARALRGARD